MDSPEDHLNALNHEDDILAADEESESSRPALEVIVPEGVFRERADKVLARHFTNWSREKLAVAFETHEVLRQGVALLKKTPVSAGEVLSIVLPELEASSVEPVNLPVDVLFEDEHLVIINKDAGIVVHPGSGIKGPTLVHALLHHTGGQLARAAGKERPGIVHRLDKDTTGIMIFAKTDEAYYRFNRMFSHREVHKEYLALTRGTPRLHSGTQLKPIGRHKVYRTRMMIREDGRPAHTDWTVVKNWGIHFSLIRCRIHTGRTHQIRVHLADLGHPVAGDATYGYRNRPEDPINPDRMLLHSHHTWFTHPMTHQLMDFRAPLKPPFESAMQALDKACV